MKNTKNEKQLGIKSDLEVSTSFRTTIHLGGLNHSQDPYFTNLLYKLNYKREGFNVFNKPSGFPRNPYLLILILSNQQPNPNFSNSPKLC